MRKSDSAGSSASGSRSDSLLASAKSVSVTPIEASGSVDPIDVLKGKQPKETTGFRNDIEGLRGFTLLAIVGWHISMPGVSGGFVGPDIFFEISGFVITGQLWKQVSST